MFRNERRSVTSATERIYFTLVRKDRSEIEMSLSGLVLVVISFFCLCLALPSTITSLCLLFAQNNNAFIKNISSMSIRIKAPARNLRGKKRWYKSLRKMT
jgi:hypothetical protein